MELAEESGMRIHWSLAIVAGALLVASNFAQALGPRIDSVQINVQGKRRF